MSARDEQRLQVIGDFREGRISRQRAAELCQVSARTISRLARKVRRDGPSAVMHGNKGRSPVNKSSYLDEARAVDLVKSTYYDFNLRHAWELLKEKHGLSVSYDTFWRWCVKHNAGRRRKRRPSKARIARERMSSRGMMLQMDGSHHAWNGREKWCLIGAIDDASSEIPACRFFESEDTFSALSVIGEIIKKHGIPCSIYVDRGKAFGGIRDEEENQFRRACEELGITVISALSPQAKGRVERMWRTFQDRLIPELRLLGINTMKAANEYLETHFIPTYWNVRNSVQPREGESRYRKAGDHLDLKSILCKQYRRRLRTNQTFDFRGRTYRLKSPVPGSIAGEEVIIREYQDDGWRVYFRSLEAKFTPWGLGRRERPLKKAS